jgi:nucleotide-binding universal stress UspA family protein
MYSTIYVPVDNSDHSNQAVATATKLGQAFGAKLVGCHVYAAQMHDYRFKQMEYTLPPEYLEETELERQRKIHDSLISMGLKLISDSYLDPMGRKCEEAGLEFERKMMDGKHHVELAKDISESDYDLIVIGALGLGKVRDSQLGSVTERVSRACNRDFLITKTIPSADEPESDTIVVAIDGSPQCFGGLMTAVELARKMDKKIELLGVYDPYLHYAVFSGIVDVLSDQAAKVFKFEEQNQLHEEIIDTGLAQIYQSHLDVAERMVAEEGVEVSKTLLDGKAFQKILDHCRKTEPWLLVLGRIGVHSDADDSGLGSTTENLLRACPCDLYLSARQVRPQLDLKAEESVRWTQEAEDRMVRVPEQVKGVARTAILRLAVEQGHSVITSSVIDDAMDRFMPKRSSQLTRELAEAVAIDRASRQPTAICKSCGVTATESNPVKCSVCGASDFEQITSEMLERIAKTEGGVEEEETYDGRSLKWTVQARKALRGVPDKYQRRRSKARIEKSARLKKLDTVTLEFARAVIADETGEELPDVESSTSEVNETQSETAADGRHVVATDIRGNALLSERDWTEDSIARVLRVPAGFMRDKIQERVEELASERNLGTIDLDLVEEGIEQGRKVMEEMVRGYGNNLAEQPSRETFEAETKAAETPPGTCPALVESAGNGKRYGEGHYTQGDPSLNEAGEMHAKATSNLSVPDEDAPGDVN